MALLLAELAEIGAAHPGLVEALWQARTRVSEPDVDVETVGVVEAVYGAEMVPA